MKFQGKGRRGYTVLDRMDRTTSFVGIVSLPIIIRLSRSRRAINRQDLKSLPEDGPVGKVFAKSARITAFDRLHRLRRRCIWCGKISWLLLPFPLSIRSLWLAAYLSTARFSRGIYYLPISPTKRKSFLLTYVTVPAVCRYPGRSMNLSILQNYEVIFNEGRKSNCFFTSFNPFSNFQI